MTTFEVAFRIERWSCFVGQLCGDVAKQHKKAVDGDPRLNQCWDQSAESQHDTTDAPIFSPPFASQLSLYGEFNESCKNRNVQRLKNYLL